MSRPRPPVLQRGIAVVTALLLASLVAILTAQWFAAQDALGRTIEVQRNGTQARWLLIGAIDWAQKILIEKAQKVPNVDHLTEIWNFPVEKLPVSDVSGRIEGTAWGNVTDAQARFNLADLVNNTGGFDGDGIAALQRLCDAVSVSKDQCMLVAKATKASVRLPPGGAPTPAPQPTPAPTASPNPAGPPTTAFMPQIKSALDLQGMGGIQDATLELLAPHTTVYPRISYATNSPININTADAPAIASIDPVFVSLAQAIVSKRNQLTYFKNTADVKTNFPAIETAMAAQPNQPNQAKGTFTVRSDHFIARGRILLGRVDFAREALIKRGPSKTEIIWVRDL